MRRGIRVLVASTAFLLFAAFATDASWAQTKIARVGILDNGENVRALTDWPSSMHFYQTLGEHGWVEGKNVIFEVRAPSGGDPF